MIAAMSLRLLYLILQQVLGLILLMVSAIMKFPRLGGFAIR